MLSFMKSRKSVGPQNGSAAASSPQKPAPAASSGAAVNKEIGPLGRLLLHDLEGLRADKSRKFAKLRDASSEATRFQNWLIFLICRCSVTP